jgi:ATP-independent RNA helicase DbpA
MSGTSAVTSDGHAAGFDTLSLPPSQLQNLQDMGYAQMTPVQALSLPAALQGRDLIAQAKTGSGKTAAFGIALLQRLNPRDFGTQALVLCPTRELATQVATQLRKLARYLPNIKIVVLCGGQPLGPQIASLEHGAHVVVATPGRLRDHLQKQTLDLGRVNTLVLDEADRMLDMGFAEDIDFVIGHTPDSRQTLLFSATFPADIVALSSRYQRDALQVSVEFTHDAQSIKQCFYCLGETPDEERRAAAVVRILQQWQPAACVVFCNTRQGTMDIARHLRQHDLPALALHGDLEQRERDQILVQFRNASVPFLVATDVAARGLDIAALPLVINAELPRDLDVYTHRIGRTGRAGEQGIAASLFFQNERFRVDALRERDAATASASIEAIGQLRGTPGTAPMRRMQTLDIGGGRKNKLRPGDILGALTAEQHIPASAIGRIDILEHASYVAIAEDWVDTAMQVLEQRRIKAQKFKIRRLVSAGRRQS